MAAYANASEGWSIGSIEDEIEIIGEPNQSGDCAAGSAREYFSGDAIGETVRDLENVGIKAVLIEFGGGVGGGPVKGSRS